MQKEQELAVKKRANKVFEAREAADERAIKRARACLEASSFPRLARELSEFIGPGSHVDTREVARHFWMSSGNMIDAHEEAALNKGLSSDGEQTDPRGVKPYIRMEINWDYEQTLLSEWNGRNAYISGHGYTYKHIGIHFDEDWKIHVIGLPSVVTTLSKNKWHGKLHEQGKALEKAYLHPAVFTSWGSRFTK